MGTWTVTAAATTTAASTTTRRDRSPAGTVPGVSVGIPQGHGRGQGHGHAKGLGMSPGVGTDVGRTKARANTWAPGQ